MERMKADISEIKAATLALQAEGKSLQKGMKSLRDMHDRTMVKVAQMTGDVADIKRDMATKADIGRLTGHIEGLAAKVDERLDWAKHEIRLDDHAKRLDKLEQGRT